MSMKKPKIRFKGYTEDWEQRKLGEMCTIITKQTGFDYSATIKPSLVTTKEDDTYSFIQNKDFEGMNINLDTDFYIPISVAEKYPKITLDQPSLLISISGRIGNIGLYSLDSKAFIGGAVGICKLKDIEDGKTTLYELLSPAGQKYFNSLIKASSHANITVEDIRNIEVLLPKHDEEKKRINIYFENLDHLITLHQRKCNQAKKFKKYMLQKMFPQNGEKNPEIRFGGFTDDWEQRKLSDISDVRDGTHDSPKYLNTGHPFVTSKNVKDGFINYDEIQYISDEDFNEINKRSKVDVNDILMGMIGTIGNMALIRTEPDFAIKNVALIKNTKQINYLYLYHFLHSSFIEKQLSFGVDGGTQKFVSLGNIRNLDIVYPSEAEQIKLGGYFEQLDHLITLHQRKCDELKKIKKFMLQNMFV